MMKRILQFALLAIVLGMAGCESSTEFEKETKVEMKPTETVSFYVPKIET